MLYHGTPSIAQRTGLVERVRGFDTYSPLFYVRIEEAGHAGSMVVPAQVQTEGFYPNWARLLARAVSSGTRNIRVAVEQNNGTWYIARILPNQDINYDAEGNVLPPSALVQVGNQEEVATNEYLRTYAYEGDKSSVIHVSADEMAMVYLDTSKPLAEQIAGLRVAASGVRLNDNVMQFASNRTNRAFIVAGAYANPLGTLHPIICIPTTTPPATQVNIATARSLSTTVQVTGPGGQNIGSFTLADIFTADADGNGIAGTLDFSDLFAANLLRVGSGLRIDASGVEPETPGTPPPATPDAPAPAAQTNMRVNMYQASRPGFLGINRRQNFKRLDWNPGVAASQFTNVHYEVVEYSGSTEHAGDILPSLTALVSNLRHAHTLSATVPAVDDAGMLIAAPFLETPGNNNETGSREPWLQPGFGFDDGDRYDSLVDIAGKAGAGDATTLLNRLLEGTARNDHSILLPESRADSEPPVDVVYLVGLGSSAAGLAAMPGTLVRGFITSGTPAQLAHIGATLDTSDPSAIRFTWTQANMESAGWEFRQNAYTGRSVTGTGPLETSGSRSTLNGILSQIDTRIWAVRLVTDQGVSTWATPYVTVQFQFRPGYYMRRA